MFGTRAGFFVDLFGLVFVLILPAMAVAVALVRNGNVRAHARIMVTCFVLFLVAVLAFEIDVQTSQQDVTVPLGILGFHLCFAVPCLALWIRQVVTAKRATTEPARHRTRGKLLFGLLSLTVGTGIWLYVETFV